MNFYQLLSEDHRAIERLLQAVERSQAGSQKRQERFLELTREVQLHSYLEEALVYPLLGEHSETQDASLESVEEHRVMQMLMDEMKDVMLTDERWTAKFEVFKEQLERHIREEEEQLFPAAQKVITEKQAEALGGRLITEKALRRAAIPQPVND